MRLSAPPVDCSAAEDVVEEPVWLPELADEVPLEDPLEVPETAVLASEAMEDMLDDMSLAIEEVTEAAAEEAEEALPLAAAVELAAPAAHVAAVGRLVTPWPPQRELANWIVSAERASLLVAVLFSRKLEYGEWLTLLVGCVASSADTAREAAQELAVAANALHVQVAAGAERGAHTAGCAAGETGDLRDSESGQESHGGESESVHICCVCRVRT